MAEKRRKPRRTTASAWLAEVVLYGGLRVRRVDMLRHLDALGVGEGPARLRWAMADAVPGEPEQVWDAAGECWRSVP